MSCQSVAAARAFADTDKEVTHCGTFHRTVRFTSSDSRGSTRVSSNDAEAKRETPGSISLLALSVSPVTSHGTSSAMSQSAPAHHNALDDHSPGGCAVTSCRFPKLEECAHFHYERVSLGGVSIETAACEHDDHCDMHTADTTGDSATSEGWICLRVRSHVTSGGGGTQPLATSWTEASDVTTWTLTRNARHFLALDDMLHRCIYDRKVSGLPDLSVEMSDAVVRDRDAYCRLVSDYVHHLSIIADDTINCGPCLNWLQMDNKGHKLLVANEDSSSINTPAVAAAYSVRKYVSQARDEISFEVGDMISIIDMPGPNESLWWRGKRGFRVGFFPHHCVAVIGDKVPRHMTQPPPIVGSVAVAPIKPVLRKHGKLISLFRSFILSRPSRRSLKQQGILRERVFGCDLGEHLLNCGHEVPLVLVECARVIEERGAVDGIYRLSGGSGLTQRLRAAFDEGAAPDLQAPPVARDPHALASLLKMYFRELPNPLCTYQLYESFVSAVQAGPDESVRLERMRETVVKLPPPHYRTLSYLMRHLRRVSLLGALTGMTARNMAIVWAPNLLRCPHAHHALHGIAHQAVVTEFLICYAEELFSTEPALPPGEGGVPLVEYEAHEAEVELRGRGGGRRPKSLPIAQPAKLLSLEEARRRGKCNAVAASPRLPPPSGVIARAAAAGAQLKPSASMKPKYIEVGSGPNNLPQYHTVLDLPAPGAKRGLKRSPSGWRGLFSRSKQQRQRAARRPPSPPSPSSPRHHQLADTQPMEIPACGGAAGEALRGAKSCESLQSECDALAPLATRPELQPLKQHTRSASCDSYFEPWQAELAHMRLRLSPQERDGHMFSEEDDTTLLATGAQPHQGESICSSPVPSELCSAEATPRRHLTVDVHAAPTAPSTAPADTAERKRSAMEDELASIGYIDGGDSPRIQPPPQDAARTLSAAKRVCKDRDGNSDTPAASPLGAVKLRERNSPRKAKPSSRYSGLHHPVTNLSNDLSTVTVTQNSRLSWHGKDNHSTLIKVDWPIENTSISNLTTSTLNSSPVTPLTPLYDPLESDSEISDATNKQTIKITKNENCDNCDTEKCLQCELKAADDSEAVKVDFKIGLPVTTKAASIERFESDLIDIVNLHDSLEPSPVPSANISYQNLNRLSAISTSSNSEHTDRKKEVNYESLLSDRKSVMTSSHDSSSSYSNPSKHDELYECYSFTRPNYIDLQSSSTSKSSPSSPLKSPLKSTISITFRSPTKVKMDDYELMQNMETPTNDFNTNDRDSVYEDIDLEKNLSIVEDASVPETDASLPEQQACQPDSFNSDLIILETPTEETKFDENVDVYSQVKFFRKSIEEVNAMVLESPENDDEKLSEKPHYENVSFPVRESPHNDYENIKLNVDTLRICDKDEKFYDNSEPEDLKNCDAEVTVETDNGNTIKSKRQKNFNVRELANRFESPTEQKGPFFFEKFKAEIKYPSLERKEEPERRSIEIRKTSDVTKPTVSPKSFKLSKNSANARSLDENAFVQEFGTENAIDRRKSLEVKETNKKKEKFLPDLNLNLEESQTKIEETITPTTENKISLIQRFDKPDIKNLVGFDAEKKLSRERIEKYKEERRNFLREKYSSQSFRSNPEHLTRIKIKKDSESSEENTCERLKDELPKFERRNTVDMGQRMRFSLAKSANNLDTIQSPESPDKQNMDFSKRVGGSSKFDTTGRCSKDFDRKEKVSPSYNIRDMAAMFEQKSHSNTTG